MKSDAHSRVAALEAAAKDAAQEASKLRDEIAHGAAKGLVAGFWRKHPAMLRRHEAPYLWEFVGQASDDGCGTTVYVLRRVADDLKDAWLRVVSTESLLTDYVRARAPKRRRKP